MGNKCGCGEKEDPMAAVRLEKLIRIQSVARSFLAKSKKRKMKQEKI